MCQEGIKIAIEHDAIVNAELHEPKGVSAATVNQVYVSDGASSGAWTNSNSLVGASEYAAIYTADGSTASAAITTPVELALETNGPGSVVVPDATNNRITLTTAGDYYIDFSLSYTGSASNAVWQFHARLDGVESYVGIHRKIGVGSDVGSCSFSGIVTATAGQQLTIYAESDTSSTITVSDAQLSAILVMGS